MVVRLAVKREHFIQFYSRGGIAMPSEHERFAELIDAYIDGTISDDDKTFFENHARACDTCKQELEEAKSIQSALHELPALEAPSDFTQKVNALIDKELNLTFRDKLLKHITRYRGGYSAAAACLVLAAVLGVGSLKTELTDVTPSVAVETQTAMPQESAKPLPTPPPAEEEAATETVSPIVTVTSPGIVITPTIPTSTFTASSTPTYAASSTNATVAVPTVPPEAMPSEEPDDDISSQTSTPSDTAVSSSVPAASNSPAVQTSGTPVVTALTEEEEEARERAIIDGFKEANVEVTMPGSDIDGVTAEQSSTSSDYNMSKTVAVSEEDEALVMQMLAQYQTSVGSDGYHLTTANYEAFLNDLNDKGIVYTLAGENKSGSEVLVKVVTR